MVATNAFGLGIDKADIALRHPLPDAGRAGRLLPGVGSRRPRRRGRPTACCCSCTATRRSSSSSWPAATRRKEDVADLYGALQQGGEGDTPWTLETLAAALDRPKAKLQVGLRLLRHEGVVAQGRDGRLTLTRSGLDADALDKLLHSYRRKRESDRAMLERMVFYGQTGRCRWKVLLDNFGEGDGFDACGSCDNCVRIAAAFAAAERERDVAVADPGGEPPADEAASLPQRGEIVSVPRYGQGIVDAVDAEGIAVVFAEGSRRIFLPSFVQRRAAPRRRPSRAAKVTASAA